MLRAELDAFYARAYGLTRDELRYILDPADVRGPDYPSETFRVLKTNEIARYGEYRTWRERCSTPGIAWNAEWWRDPREPRQLLFTLTGVRRGHARGFGSIAASFHRRFP